MIANGDSVLITVRGDRAYVSKALQGKSLEVYGSRVDGGAFIGAFSGQAFTLGEECEEVGVSGEGREHRGDSRSSGSGEAAGPAEPAVSTGSADPAEPEEPGAPGVKRLPDAGGDSPGQQAAESAPGASSGRRGRRGRTASAPLRAVVPVPDPAVVAYTAIEGPGALAAAGGAETQALVDGNERFHQRKTEFAKQKFATRARERHAMVFTVELATPYSLCRYAYRGALHQDTMGMSPAVLSLLLQHSAVSRMPGRSRVLVVDDLDGRVAAAVANRLSLTHPALSPGELEFIRSTISSLAGRLRAQLAEQEVQDATREGQGEQGERAAASGAVEQAHDQGAGPAAQGEPRIRPFTPALRACHAEVARFIGRLCEVLGVPLFGQELVCCTGRLTGGSLRESLEEINLLPPRLDLEGGRPPTAPFVYPTAFGRFVDAEDAALAAEVLGYQVPKDAEEEGAADTPEATAGWSSQSLTDSLAWEYDAWVARRLRQLQIDVSPLTDIVCRDEQGRAVPQRMTPPFCLSWPGVLHLNSWKGTQGGRSEPILFDSLVVASRLRTQTVLRLFSSFLRPSASVAVFTQSSGNAADACAYVRENKLGVSTAVYGCTEQAQQVLPGRTHPEMLGEGFGGYVFTYYTQEEDPAFREVSRAGREQSSSRQRKLRN